MSAWPILFGPIPAYELAEVLDPRRRVGSQPFTAAVLALRDGQ
jgi:hypothetical protein